MTKTYDIKQLRLIVDGDRMFEFAEGEAVKIEYDSEAVTKKVGADGVVVLSNNHDNSGKLTVRLNYGNPLNNVLSDKLKAQKTKLDVFAARLQDDSSGTTVSMSGCHMMNRPELPYGQEAPEAIAWEIGFTDNETDYRGISL